MRSLSCSNALYQEAQRLLVGGGQGHKRPGKVHGKYPIFAVRGEGVRFWDADDNEYIDYLCAFGPMLLGYGHARVDAAVKERIDRGMIFNIHHPSELQLAEKLCELIPCCEMVSYFTGGSGATTGAVKIARAYTGRDKVIRCGYHGWHDWCSPGRGVPACVSELTLSADYNSIGSLNELLEANKNQVAVFMLEAFQGDGPDGNYLAEVQQLCREHGVLLCFDEVKTGFRFALGGFQEHCGITPDIACFGKAIANGYDISFVCGRREIMESVGDIWIAATFHGQLLGTAAALAVIDEMQSIDGIAQIWRQGRRLMDGLEETLRKHDVDACVAGLPPMPRMKFGEGLDELRDDFYAGTIERGVYFDPGHVWFVSPMHTDEIIDYTLQVSDEAMEEALRAR